MNTPVDYDGSMEHDENQAQNWTATVRQAVAAFTKSVSETSQQLAAAADKFAADSMKAIDDVSARAEQSATRSREMANAATSAADDARAAADSVRSALNDAAEKVRAETQALLDEAVRRTEQNMQTPELQSRLDDASHKADEAFETAQRLRSDLEIRLNNILSQAGGAAERVRADLEERLNTLPTTPALTDEVQAAIDSRVEAAVQQAQEAMRSADQVSQNIEERLTAAMQRLEQSTRAHEDAAADASRAAQEAREAANQVQAGTAGSAVSESAQLVLERLETDYSLLTHLVQDLHTRISNLSGQTQEAATEPEAEGKPVGVESEPQPVSEPVSPWQASQEPPTAPAEEPPALPTTAPSWYSGYQQKPETAAAQETTAQELSQPMASAPEPAIEAETQPTVETEPMVPSTPAANSPIVQGRLLISIAPVPDFDRLLSLDGALGRMNGVANVTLADYAKEEVTFRVEIQTPTSVEDFRQRLSQSAGSDLDVVSTSEGGVALRLAS